MKGNNELHLNTATMIEVIQTWLDSKMPQDTPTVTSVKPSGRGDATFVVELSSEEIEKKDEPQVPRSNANSINYNLPREIR